MTAVVLKALWIFGLMAVLSMAIAAVIKGIVLLLERAARPAPVPVPVPAVAAAAVPPEHVAAIAAAVAATIGAHRIVHVADARGGSRWGADGRSAHQHSHTPPVRRPGR